MHQRKSKASQQQISSNVDSPRKNDSNASMQMPGILSRKNQGSRSIPRMLASRSKGKTHNLRETSIEDTRFMALDPINLRLLQKDGNKVVDSPRQQVYPEIKTDRTRTDRSHSKNRAEPVVQTDSADYYKYWKKKASEYQQQNFNLHRLNSALQQQNEILKHHIERLQKRLSRVQPPEPAPSPSSVNWSKLQSYYKVKLEQLQKRIKQQQILIEKQNIKIKELSNYIAENYQLKNVINKIQEKIMNSRDGSRDGSMERNSDSSPKKDTYLEFLAVQSNDSPKVKTSFHHLPPKAEKKVLTKYGSVNPQTGSGKWM